MPERPRAEEKVRAIIEELDCPTLALLYKTLHDALGFSHRDRGHRYREAAPVIDGPPARTVPRRVPALGGRALGEFTASHGGRSCSRSRTRRPHRPPP